MEVCRKLRCLFVSISLKWSINIGADVCYFSVYELASERFGLNGVLVSCPFH